MYRLQYAYALWLCVELTPIYRPSAEDRGDRYVYRTRAHTTVSMYYGMNYVYEKYYVYEKSMSMRNL